mgnify:FL=1
MTINDFKKEKLLALKNKDQLSGDLFGMIISALQKEEIEKKVKNEELTDADINRILMKMYKELEDDKKMYQDNNRLDDVKNIERQIEILSPYLPKMLSEDEIRKQMDKSKPMKDVIASFKGKADIQLVIKIYKE